MRPHGLTLGTAGHIDHGKTTLVKALTGKDTDRLQEERDRGISIELGFAELLLPSGRRLSVVDVPGHERFVRNMVSGATGIDLFLLVVAADDGVMPQTREHLRIIELLGIPLGVVALTKIDMVDQEMVDLAESDIEEFLEQTPYAGSAIVKVSGASGEGLPALLEALDAVAAQAPERPVYPVTRMPVDRVFSLKGIGTVVTGTLWSGELHPEDSVVILPAPRGDKLEQVRVRSIQVHERAVESAAAGQRVALNLTGAGRDQVERGQWIVQGGGVRPTYLVDVWLTLLPDAGEPFARVTRGRVDHGTRETLAKLVLADREQLRPGGSAYAQVRFEEEVLMYPGDRFILRAMTPVTTVGGGRVVDPSPRKHGTDPRWRERLEVMENGPPEEIVRVLLEDAFPQGIPKVELIRSPYLWRWNGADTVTRVLERRLATEAGGRLFHADALAGLEERALDALRGRAAAQPLDPYLASGELRPLLTGGQEVAGLEVAVDRLVARGDAVRTEHGIRWAEAPGALEGKDAEIAEGLLLKLAEAGVEVPPESMLPDSVGLPRSELTRLLGALQRQGRLVKVGEDLYYPADSLQQLMNRITSALEASNQITLAEVRDLLGTSRRYAQALLEHMDSEGLTLRVGDARRLRRRRAR